MFDSVVYYIICVIHVPLSSSPHASKLNYACGSITGCLMPNNVEKPYLISGIAPPDIRRHVSYRVEKKTPETNAAHSRHCQVPETLDECFLSSVRPADFPTKFIRCTEWQAGRNWHHTTALSSWITV